MCNKQRFDKKEKDCLPKTQIFGLEKTANNARSWYFQLSG